MRSLGAKCLTSALAGPPRRSAIGAIALSAHRSVFAATGVGVGRSTSRFFPFRLATTRAHHPPPCGPMRSLSLRVAALKTVTKKAAAAFLSFRLCTTTLAYRQPILARLRDVTSGWSIAARVGNREDALSAPRSAARVLSVAVMRQ